MNDPEDELTKVKEVQQYFGNRMRALDETPISFLTPEAHEDALKVSHQVWAEAMRVLGDQHKYDLYDQAGKWMLSLQKYDKEHPPHRSLEGSELTIRKAVIREIDEPKFVQHRAENYDFMPKFVLRTLWRTAQNLPPKDPIADLLKSMLRTNKAEETYNKKEPSPGEYTATRGLAVEKEEANRDQLNELLEILRAHTE